MAAAEKESVDLLIAGAFEGKDVANRCFLGGVARPLAKLKYDATLSKNQARSGGDHNFTANDCCASGQLGISPSG
jgi:hypothetical protein